MTTTCRRMGIALLTLASMALATAGPSRAEERLSKDTAAALTSQFDHLFRGQRADGALPLDGEYSFYGAHPILATIALDIHQGHGNAAFASRASAAMSRYYGFLFSDRDANRNLLIETADDSERWVEDPGYNSMLALDLLALARLNLELQRPWQAMYWYEGSRLVQEAVVSGTFDPGANFFFPRDTATGQLVREIYALSALPVVFGGRVGDTHATTLVREYILKAATHQPESPAGFLHGPAVPEPAFEVRRLMLMETLLARGFHAQARAARGTYTVEPGVLDSPEARYISERLAVADGYRAQIMTPLELFAAMALALKPVDDAHLLRFEQSVAKITGFDAAVDTDEAELRAVGDAARVVFATVSSARDRLGERELFTDFALQEMSGLDPDVAADRLFDDVAQTLRLVENDVFRARFADANLSVAVTLSRDRAVIGRALEAHWNLRAQNDDIEFRSIAMGVRDQHVPLSEHGVLLNAGAEPLSFAGRFNLSVPRPHALYPVPLTLIVNDGSGQRSHFTTWRSVYVDAPLDVQVSFPQGKMLDGSSVPIDVSVRNRSGDRVIVSYEWFSPTGLKLTQGRTAEWTIESKTDSATARLDVIVPSPCRPGRFPFKLKLYGDGTEMGTFATTMYKPYNWVVVGPFPDSPDAMTTAYPPEQRVELMATYDGAQGPIEWKPLGPEAYNERGEVTLRREMPVPGAAYLHTVVETPYEIALPALLWANTNAALFINGVRVLDFTPAAGKEAAYARVQLERGLNNVLIKLIGDASSRAYFNLGDESDEASYAFNNNLWELIDGYAAFHRRSAGQRDDDNVIQRLVTLRYEDPEAHTVAVVGNFNGWSPEHSPLRKLSAGRWEIVLSLTPGRYAYRFVINNRQQIVDPSNATLEADGFGGQNSVIVVE